MPHLIAGSPLLATPDQSLRHLLHLLGVQSVALGVPIILWIVIGRQKWRDALALRPTTVAELFGATMLAGGMILAVPVISSLQSAVLPVDAQASRKLVAVLGPMLSEWPALAVAGIPGVAAVTEEFFFRGLLQRALVKRMPAWIVIVLGAILFAAMHLDMQGFIVRALLGAILGWLVYSGGSLLPALWLHFFYDAALLGTLAVTIRTIGLEKLIKQSAGPSIGVAPLVSLTLISATCLLGGFSLCLGEHRKRAEAERLERERLERERLEAERIQMEGGMSAASLPTPTWPPSSEAHPAWPPPPPNPAPTWPSQSPPKHD